ncbi:MAG: amino acid ABC transporter permease [Oscillibacter sp.]|nr:amino acid ABC transporter permease [Oscillibacter sp.]
MFNMEFARATMGAILREGLPATLTVVFWTLVISLPLGFLLGLIRFRRVPVLMPLSTVVISFFRGTPLVILIFLLYSALPDALARLAQIHGWGIDVYGLLLGSTKGYAVFICSTFTISTMAEIFRSALGAVEAGQLEAAHCVGLSTAQAYWHIVIPQALVSALPNLGNDVIGLVKGTSLMFYMGLKDIMGVAKTEAGPAYAYVEAYVDVLIVYVVLCFILQELFRHLEQRLRSYGAKG